MSSDIWKAIRSSSEYALKIGDEFEVDFPDKEGDPLLIRIPSRHEFLITCEMLEKLGKPLRLG
jgi:hypothetical protein